MTDFETMPVGTRETIRETAALLREYERNRRDEAELQTRVVWRRINLGKAERNAIAAAKLEALLVVEGVERGPLETLAAPPQSETITHGR